METTKFENVFFDRFEKQGYDLGPREPKRIFREAKILLYEGNFEESLEYSIKSREILSQQVDMADKCVNELSYLRHNLTCYICLGDKKRVKNTLKKIKRIDRNMDFESWAPLVEAMRHTSNVKRKTDRVRAMCSYPFCEMIESKSGEFRVCGKCRIQKYCNVFQEDLGEKYVPKRSY